MAAEHKFLCRQAKTAALLRRRFCGGSLALPTIETPRSEIMATSNSETLPRSADLPNAKAARLCIIVTVDLTIQNLCRGRLEYFSQNGFDVTVVCAPTPLAEEIEARGARLHTAPLTRSITPWRDLRALWNLYRFLLRERFDIVEVSTPKAALLGSVAARWAGVPVVVHLLRGLAYQHQGVFAARLLRFAQRLTCRCAHRTVAIAQTMLDQARLDGVCPPEKIVMLGRGSSNGVDLQRFAPVASKTRCEMRRRIGLPADVIVAGFVGRMTRDKGLVELIDAFAALAAAIPDLHLLLVGNIEQRDRPPYRTMETIDRSTRIAWVGWQDDTRSFLGAMDFLVLPTYREGMATVLLEAAACGLPLLTTEASGWSEVDETDRTALFVPPGDAPGLAAAMERLATCPNLRSKMGRAARQSVEQHFENQAVWHMQEQEFRRLLGE
jgi:glycosyltransferase involved in cell wall biosynthesis